MLDLRDGFSPVKGKEVSGGAWHHLEHQDNRQVKWVSKKQTKKIRNIRSKTKTIGFKKTDSCIPKKL
ncbi:hypothetical protein P6N53_10115 [Desulforamulus aquiferis]|uniref:Uncharacterized protein n=1 Tax=Desulforamulus aquiferis TaxID=1397668 RepID=A0AAW7ZFL8_9FIRM|nr:hypothetical protein [Desulforamulus aquiferis]MDO7787575.1 hypothetical protein [Desulforamulus aquiferis]RYD01453.1 hypothetical protein N752_31140 [Desulforamulus aquiferis]